MDKKQTVDPINKARISLSDRLKKRGDSPKYLTNEVKSPAELELNALKEIIRLREEGKPRDSLALIHECFDLGMDNPWLYDNQARALLLMGQFEEARIIWKKLARHDDQEVASIAQKALTVLDKSKSEKSLQESALSEKNKQDTPNSSKTRHQLLLELINTNPELTKTIKIIIPDFTEKILNEKNGCIELLSLAIDLRNKGWVLYSLRFLDYLEKAGFSSDWIEDNRARALIMIGKVSQARAKWKQLLETGESKAAEQSALMLAKTQQDLRTEEIAKDLAFDLFDDRFYRQQYASEKDIQKLTKEEAFEHFIEQVPNDTHQMAAPNSWFFPEIYKDIHSGETPLQWNSLIHATVYIYIYANIVAF